MSAALTSGIVTTKVKYLEERVRALEDDVKDVMSHYLTREEYQKFHATLENKIDKIMDKVSH
jgi:hypothetical protein